MLSISVRNEPDSTPVVVDIMADVEGLEMLKHWIDGMLSGRIDHMDMMTEEWGGTHLDRQLYDSESSPIEYLKIFRTDFPEC